MSSFFSGAAALFELRTLPIPSKSPSKEVKAPFSPMDDHIDKHLASIKIVSARPDLLALGQKPLVKEQSNLGKAGSFIRSNWDRGSFKFLPKLATPSIVLGCLLGSVGLLLFGSSAFQKSIPFMEKLFGDASLSFMLSMVLMRTGLHLVDSGVRFSRTKERTRHDTLKQYRLFAVKYLNDKSSVDVTSEMIEIKRMDQRMDPSLRILQDKRIEDLIKKPLQALKADLSYTVHTGKWKKWYNFWERDAQPTLGRLDIGLGILMISVALLGTGMILASRWVDIEKFPSTFALIAQDPYLSTSFVFILLANAITCIKIGTQMTGFRKRNGKRDEITDDLQKIQEALEGKKTPVPREEKKPPEITPEPPPFPRLARFWKRLTPDLVPVGKGLTHTLAPISTVVGVILVGLGFFYLAISAGRKIPRNLEFLAANSKITLPFATGTIISGFHAIYRGSSLSEKKMKTGWKERSIQTREALFAVLAEPPRLQAPGANHAPQIPVEVQLAEVSVQPKKARDKLVGAALEKKEADKKYRSWLNSFLWLPDGIAGGVLLYCGVAVLLTLTGAIRPPNEIFTNKSSFASSLIFSIGLIAVSVDAFLCAYRIGTYNKRKQEDSQFVEDLQAVLRKQIELRA